MPKDSRFETETYWQVIGEGPRPALAVHCMLGSSEMWAPVLAPLGEMISATAFDLPGHGQSAPWDAANAEPGAYQTLATRIAASFIDRPVDLIGHSFGASVALRIAVGAPHAIRSLTLIEPVLFAAAKGSAEWEELRPHQDRLDALLAGGEHEEAARRFMRDWGAGVPWEALAEKHRARFTAQMPIVANVTPANFEDPRCTGDADPRRQQPADRGPRLRGDCGPAGRCCDRLRTAGRSHAAPHACVPDHRSDCDEPRTQLI